VAPTISPGSRTFTVTVEIPNPDMLLRPGMYAEVELVLERHETALLVPETAVLDRAGRTVVFVVEARESAGGETGPGGAVAREREVRTGLAAPGSLEVLEGITLRDRVVVEGNTFLEDGQAVVIVKD
jgi:membrane fusion protein (multidrug efflux system)